MVAGEWRKILYFGKSCVKVVGSSGNFRSEQAHILDMWVSGYCRTVESPRNINRKASIPLQ